MSAFWKAVLNQVKGIYMYIYIYIYLSVCFTLESNLRNGCGFMHTDHRFSKALVKPS